MRRTVAKVALAVVLASLLNGAYNTFAWQYFDMPYPGLIAPDFRMWGADRYDTIEMEWWSEFFLIGLAVVFGGDWLWERAKSTRGITELP